MRIQGNVLPSDIFSLSNLTTLDLSRNQLISLPDSLAELENLTTLDLSRNQLISIPSSLTKLENLTILDLRRNKLTSLPDSLAKLENLTTLDLSRNQLTSLPDSLTGLENLASLNLRFNKLRYLPNCLAELENLTTLDLSRNQLISLPDSLVGLQNLTVFDLMDNKLTFMPTSLTELQSLTTLDLSDNQLTSLPDSLMLQNLITLNLRYNKLISLPDSLKLQNLSTLNLSNNQLISLPNSLTGLQNLTTLDLSNNQLTSLPYPLTLQSLITLNLRYNELISLPDSLKLQNLTQLDLNTNKLTSLPSSFTELQNLTTLDLSNNQLTSLPDSLRQLQNLTTLDLSNNQLTSLPYSLKGLQNLTKLYLRNNQLISLSDSVYELDSLEELRLENDSFNEGPGNQIQKISSQILQLTNLRELNLEGNPIEMPQPEIVAKGLEAIKDYFRQLKEEGKAYIYEAKLLIVGEGGAGKTTLAKKIENPAYKLQLQPAEKSTEGIDVIKWQFEMDNGEPFYVNIWDFGGQEIYHATHQFFLTKRSLYVLVCDTRKEDTDFYYWLNVVELLSDNSPLLIIKNEKQDREREIPERQLRGQFTNLKETLATNLATNRGLSNIDKKIKHYLMNLDHIGEKLPKTWVKVREALEQDLANHIRLSDYLVICRQNGFTERKNALQLSSYLHDLGVILHFQDDQTSLLYRTVILKPEWGTTAVYRVLDNKKVIANLGRFTQDDLSEIWHEPDYGNMLGELLELMLKFQLCYHIPAQKLYIAPQLLTPNQPDYEWDARNNLILRYTASEFMPKGIITRFIVAMHHLIFEQKYVWREGVILAKDKTRAEVIEYYGKRELRIRISGQYRRDLMIVVTNELDKLFDSFHRLKYSKLIPCNCPACKGSQEPHFYDYEKLREFASYGRDDERCDNRPYHTVSVRSLIDDFPLQVDEGKRQITHREGDKVLVVNMGDNNYGDTITQIGDFSGSNINLKSKLEKVSQTINNNAKTDQATKTQLTDLLVGLNQHLQQLPKEQAEDVEALSEIMKGFVEAATKEKANKMMVHITSKSLLEIAKNLAKIRPPVLPIVKQIVTLLGGSAV